MFTMDQNKSEDSVVSNVYLKMCENTICKKCGSGHVLIFIYDTLSECKYKCIECPNTWWD